MGEFKNVAGGTTEKVRSQKRTLIEAHEFPKDETLLSIR